MHSAEADEEAKDLVKELEEKPEENTYQDLLDEEALKIAKKKVVGDAPVAG